MSQTPNNNEMNDEIINEIVKELTKNVEVKKLVSSMFNRNKDEPFELIIGTGSTGKSVMLPLPIKLFPPFDIELFPPFDLRQNDK